jgi:hypothetical protein
MARVTLKPTRSLAVQNQNRLGEIEKFHKAKNNKLKEYEFYESYK